MELRWKGRWGVGLGAKPKVRWLEVLGNWGISPPKGLEVGERLIGRGGGKGKGG